MHAELTGPAPDLLRRTTAEALAAFALVFAGCGAIVADARYDGVLGAVGVSLVFGLIIMVMVYATGHLSGAHINPAVTLFELARGNIGWRLGLLYVPVQIASAILGVVVAHAMFAELVLLVGREVLEPGDEDLALLPEGAGDERDPAAARDVLRHGGAVVDALVVGVRVHQQHPLFHDGQPSHALSGSEPSRR